MADLARKAAVQYVIAVFWLHRLVNMFWFTGGGKGAESK